MDAKQVAAKQAEIEKLQARIAELEVELTAGGHTADFSKSYYLTYYATAGFFLGMVGAITSLLFNIVGATAVGKDSVELIKTYLPYGLGAQAVEPGFDNGLALAMGCCLYIGTGMLLGIPFHVILTKFASDKGLGGRLAFASALGLAIWIINFYILLSWLQPLMFGGNWIVRDIPWWVAAATHLVFAWTMAVVYPWGLYQPYRLQTEQS